MKYTSTALVNLASIDVPTEQWMMRSRNRTKRLVSHCFRTSTVDILRLHTRLLVTCLLTCSLSYVTQYGAGELDYSKAPRAYKGTEVFLNLWKPHVANSQEFSLGQLALTAGPNTMEAGHQVLPTIPRLPT